WVDNLPSLRLLSTVVSCEPGLFPLQSGWTSSRNGKDGSGAGSPRPPRLSGTRVTGWPGRLPTGAPRALHRGGSHADSEEVAGIPGTEPSGLYAHGASAGVYRAGGGCG